MNPIKLSHQLQTTLTSYLTTTFDVNRDRQEPALAKFIKDSFQQPRALFAGPYLELTSPYKTAESLQALSQAGVLSPRLLQMGCFQYENPKPLPIDAPLYTHQAKALRKLCVENRNIVVSSGTGSGKTECFLIPILNDLLIDPSPGVRAILIYPLNALVNDQLDRLRVLLQGTNITFGRYTSELLNSASRAEAAMKKEWEEMEPDRRKLFDQYPLPNEIIGRDQIREQGMLPQILITNYAMLEYLMLRPQDSPLFKQGKWKFVVLDEAHSYAGAQGIEVGLLMRRLKHRLKLEPGHMRCIATSATLTDDDAEPARDFAEALFGEKFTTDDIIFGEPNHEYIPPATPRQPPAEVYVHPQFDQLLHNVRQGEWESTDEMALLMLEMGLISEDELSLAETLTPPQFLWEVLRGNEDLAKLRRLMTDKGQPVEVTAVAETLFSQLPREQRQDAMYHLIELAAMARQDIDEPSLLPARYHLFVRPPQGIWACLNPTCPDKQTEEQYSKLFATPRETCDACHAPVYPLVVCRTCGQVYVRMQKVGKQYLPEAAVEEDAEKHYLTWHPININRALADEKDEDEDDEDMLMAQTGETILKQTEMTLCLVCSHEVKPNGKCGCGNKSEQIVTLHLLQKERPVKRGKRRGTKDEVVTHMNECGRCHSRALKKTEIATDITMNALTPLAILTDDLYRELPQSKNPSIQRKAGGGRKLLSFYDSRQGAARFAAFVQDVVNQQAYRRIIQEAVTAVSTSTFLPDLEKMSETCLELALRYRLVHNDPEISKGDLPRDSQYLNQSQQERLIRHMRKQIFAEITTQLRSRQSLEALALMSVQYYEPDKLPDFVLLAQQLGLTPTETRTLVENLLDELRRNKVVVMPDGVKRDDAIFGRNKFSPRIVRQDASQYEIAWVGKTHRHRRRRLVQKVLQYKGLASDETAVINALNDILDWLIDKSGILDTSRPADGYQIRQDRLFFQANTTWYRCDQCQRLNCRGGSLPCPHSHCHGKLRPIKVDDLAGDNFYYDNLRQSLIPMRIEEHTAQLDPQKGRQYQNLFKNGEINMLSCSTTFEMGIDLGDLQAVVMSNIPPTVANYKQRAGRAGRRTSGTAFILAWASNRPHDQTYFKTPAEIINGRVRVPYLDVQNKVIVQRHVNAILLSEFLRYCAAQRGYDKTVGAFFDEQTPDGSYYSLFAQWLSEQESYLLQLLEKYADAVKQSIDPQIALSTFAQDLLKKGYEHYQTVAGYYKDAIQKSAQQLVEISSSGQITNALDQLSKEIQRFRQLLDRFRGEDIINHLSDRGVLPSYSFPLHTVELRIPPQLLESRQLRLQRNLQQAIREYAPGQEVVADKRIWKSEALDFFGKFPQIFSYHICPTCNYLRMEETAGKALEGLEKPCPVCHTPAARGQASPNQYIQPDGFRVSPDSGQPAGQYVDRPYNLMKSALVPGPVSTKSIGTVLSTGYDRTGSLLYVNEGASGHGFRICRVCGKHVKNPRSNKCDGYLNGEPCPGNLSRKETYTLGFKQDTDTLHLKFSSMPNIPLREPDDISFWLSLKYALLQGASRALQIERRDIDGVLFPEGSAQQWRQTIVLYDNVSGGAGHVKRIEKEIQQVVAAALEIVNCDCESSCYRCLREYSNQWVHHLLDRHPVEKFLRALDADLQQNSQVDASGMHPVAAINQTVWLWEQLQHANQDLILSADTISLNSPTAGGENWLDLIQTLLQRQVSVRLFLRQLPEQKSGDPDSIAMTTHLRLLLGKGLDLRLTNRLLPVTAVIDANTATPSAIKTADGEMISLTDNIATQLYITHHDNVVSDIWYQLNAYRGQVVEYAHLQEPANTIVKEIKPDGKIYREADFFTEFYAQPVRGMEVSDRYLDTEEKILNRLKAHIELAHKGGSLEWVLVHTRQKQGEQSQAINQLKAQFPQIRIKFNFDYRTVHDRFIELTRANGNKARLIIGVGLDFIEPNGRVRQTFIIFQDAYQDM